MMANFSVPQDAVKATNRINRAANGAVRFVSHHTLPESDKMELKIRQSLRLFSALCRIKNINLPLDNR
jgi:hypothetical protein